MPRGGKRPNTGPKPGSHRQATISALEEKAIARAVIREHVKAHIPAIVRAHVDNAMGVPYMVLRAPDGSFVRATDEKQVDAALAAGAASFKLYTKEPHQGSASMLLSYAADKAVEPVEVTGKDGAPLFEGILKQARTRAAQRD